MEKRRSTVCEVITNLYYWNTFFYICIIAKIKTIGCGLCHLVIFMIERHLKQADDSGGSHWFYLDSFQHCHIFFRGLNENNSYKTWLQDTSFTTNLACLNFTSEGAENIALIIIISHRFLFLISLLILPYGFLECKDWADESSEKYRFSLQNVSSFPTILSRLHHYGKLTGVLFELLFA